MGIRFRLPILAGLLLASAAAAFFAVRSLDSGGAINADTAAPLPTEATAEVQFTGDLLGLWFGADALQVPDRYITAQDICGPPGAVAQSAVAPEAASSLDLKFQLPPEYVLQNDSMNTGAVACGSTVFAVRWHYTTEVPANVASRADVTISRSRITADHLSLPSERISIQKVGGRDAIVVQPSTAPGTDVHGFVIFPETFGMTQIQASFLSPGKLLDVATTVALASGDAVGN